MAGRSWVLLEKEARSAPRSDRTSANGYHFGQDRPLGFNLRDPYNSRSSSAALLGDQMVRIERKARIFSNGALTRFPFQGNL